MKRLKKIQIEGFLLDKEDIAEKYMKIAFAVITDFTEFGTKQYPVFDDEGKIMKDSNGNIIFTTSNYMNFKDCSQVDGGLIREISFGKAGMKVKLEDRMKALQWLSDYLEMNPMSRHKKDYDNAILKLREKELKIKEDGW